MRIRPLLAGLTVALAGSAVTLAGTGRGAAAASVAPTAQAWWYVANNGSVPPPPPPGVNPGDLLVAGSKGDQSLPGAPAAPSPFSSVGDRGGASAIAAVRYAVPAGQAVDRLVLQFDGRSQSSVSMAACRIPGGSFKAELEGPWADLPAYDCSTPSIASLSPDGKAVEFTDIGALVSGAVLAVVIVPQYAAYDTLLPPGPGSLQLRTAPQPYTAGSAAPSSPPSAGAGAAPGSAGGSGGSGSGSGAGASVPGSTAPPRSAGSAFVPPPLPAPVTTIRPPAAATGPPGATASVQAPAAPGAIPPAQAATLPAADDGRARVASAVGLAAVLAAFGWLIAGDLPRIRRLLAARLAGPGVALPEPETARGVGRFRRERIGRPPEV